MAVDVCHLTVLNPPRHPRIFHREARSQAMAGLTVCVIAQASGPHSTTEYAESILLIGLPRLLRSSLTQRFRRAWRVVYTARKQQTRLVHLHAPELLLPALLMKPLTGWKVVYDMHEDYPRQLRDSPGWPKWLRYLLGAGVRVTEWCAAPFLDYVWYAEASYRGNLPVANHKCDVLGNFYAAPSESLQVEERPFPFPTLLSSGTLGTDWGTLRAVELWIALNSLGPVGMVVAGHAPLPDLVEVIRLRAEAAGLSDRLRLEVSATPLVHERIMSWIHACDAGLALYSGHEWLAAKVPSKFYEYMAAGTPLVFTAHDHWRQLNDRWEMGFPFSGNAEELPSLYRWLNEVFRHPKKVYPDSIWSWGHLGGPKLVAVTKKLLG